MTRIRDAWSKLSPARRVAAVVGTVYVLVGALGFAFTTAIGFSDRDGHRLLAFEVNPLHNLVHLTAGLALLAAATRDVAARVVNGALGAVFLLLGLAGFALVRTTANVLALNHADNVLHVATGAILLLSVLGRRRSELGEVVGEDREDVSGSPEGAASEGESEAIRRPSGAGAGVGREGPSGRTRRAGGGTRRTGGGARPFSARELARRPREELYALARDLGVTGRSRMSKEELAKAIARSRARQGSS